MKPDELERALAELTATAQRGSRPGHFQARDVLLALGRRLEEQEALAPELLERAREAGTRLGPAWRRAVEAELTLAVAEFVRSVDPRYLDLPNYDLEYTHGSRRRLGWRLEAARALGFHPTQREFELLGFADGAWSEALRKRAGDADDAAEGPQGSSGAGNSNTHQ